MNFTFGIITSNTVDQSVLNSIYDQNIPKFDIIVVGGHPPINHKHYRSPITHIPFNETIKQNWITRKKNIITENAKYNNIVFMHDYVQLSKNWYTEFLKFGDEWDICMNKIYNLDNTRFRDWCAYDDPEINWPGGGYPETHTNNGHRIMLPSYKYDKKQYMYISGTYWVAKKYVMEQEPLNESLVWGESEDVEWSKRVLNKYDYKMNTDSIVTVLKQKRLSAEYLD